MRNDKAFHAVPHSLDTEKQTFGRRYTSPEICAKNPMPMVCAFARTDNICLAPPVSRPKQF